MTGLKRREKQRELQQGVPAHIVEWVDALAHGPRADVYRRRLRRFAEHWRGDAAIEKHWRILQANANSDDALLSLFITLPDAPANPQNPSDYQPYVGVYGRRTTLPSKEAERYRVLGEQAAALAAFLSPRQADLKHLLADLCATQGGMKLAQQVRDECGQPVRHALRVLAQAFAAVDPFAKIPTKQANSPDRAITIYTGLVADLARFLSSPKWEALAAIANVNSPTCIITADALRRQAKRKADRSG